MKIHIGNLEITKKNENDFLEITEVTGYLRVYGSAKLDAPLLTTVGGDVYVHGSAKLEALTTVGGYVYVHGSAKLEAPVLTTVGGDVYVHGSAKLEAPVLATIGGNVSVDGSVKLEALTTVGGNVSVHGSAKLDAPNLKNKNDNRALTLSFSLYGLIKIDGILSRLLSEKTIGDVTVFELKIVGKTKTSYAVKRGDKYAHGETIDKAIEDLRYKISNRDVSAFNHWRENKEITIDQAIEGYRTITGACEQGVRGFVESLRDLPEKITPEKIIKLTNGKFGNDVLSKFLEER